jgi:hypothetical protein
VTVTPLEFKDGDDLVCSHSLVSAGWLVSSFDIAAHTDCGVPVAKRNFRTRKHTLAQAQSYPLSDRISSLVSTMPALPERWFIQTHTSLTSHMLVMTHKFGEVLMQWERQLKRNF